MSAEALPVKDSHTSLPPQNGRGYRTWTIAEVRKLTAIYPVHGIAAAAKVLGRTRSSCYCKARGLDLQGPSGGEGGWATARRVKWPASPEIDAAILATYQRKPTSRAVNDLARALGRPRWWVSKRAQQLGLVAPRFKTPEWSDEENILLEATFHLHPESARRRFKRSGFDRTVTAIVVHRKQIGLRAADQRYFNASQVALVLGVSPSTVADWIEKHGLRARRRGTERTEKQGGDHWWISRVALREFIRDNSARVDLRKVDRVWFIDFAFGPK